MMNTDNLLLRGTEAEITRNFYIFIDCIFVCPNCSLHISLSGFEAGHWYEAQIVEE